MKNYEINKPEDLKQFASDNYYRVDGNLTVNCSLNISTSLSVEGLLSIEAGGYIKGGGYIFSFIGNIHNVDALPEEVRGMINEM